jgi:hypothetical protein
MITQIKDFCLELIRSIKLRWGYETFEDDNSLVVRGEFPTPLTYEELQQIYNTITKNKYLDMELFPIGNEDTIYVGLVVYHKGTKSLLHITDTKFAFVGTLLCYFQYFSHIRVLRSGLFENRVISITTDKYKFDRPIDIFTLSLTSHG